MDRVWTIKINAGTGTAKRRTRIAASCLPGNEYRTVRVTPVKKKDGSYALGLWVKDDISGIGTITYTDGERFAALGHSINDNDTGIMFRVSDGAVYETTIVRIKSRKRISRDDWRASSIIPDGM